MNKDKDWHKRRNHLIGLWKLDLKTEFASTLRRAALHQAIALDKRDELTDKAAVLRLINHVHEVGVLKGLLAVYLRNNRPIPVEQYDIYPRDVVQEAITDECNRLNKIALSLYDYGTMTESEKAIYNG